MFAKHHKARTKTEIKCLQIQSLLHNYKIKTLRKSNSLHNVHVHSSWHTLANKINKYGKKMKWRSKWKVECDNRGTPYSRCLTKQLWKSHHIAKLNYNYINLFCSYFESKWRKKKLNRRSWSNKSKSYI